MPAGRPTLYKPEFCDMLVEHMKDGKSFEDFAAVVHCCWDTLYHWCKVHPEFSEAKKQGRAYEIAWWNNILRGGASGRIVNYNAVSTIFALKNKAPQFYRDKVTVDHDTSDETKQKLKALLDDPKHREAARIIAEALASDDEPGSSE